MFLPEAPGFIFDCGYRDAPGAIRKTFCALTQLQHLAIQCNHMQAQLAADMLAAVSSCCKLTALQLYKPGGIFEVLDANT